MKMLLEISSLLFAAVGSLFAGAGPDPQAKKKLLAAHLTLTPPLGWAETPVIANGQMSYDYALHYPGRRLEVRYAVRPLAEQLADYARRSADKNQVAIDPNQQYQTLFRTIVLNVSAGGQSGPAMAAAMQAIFAQPLQEFPPAAVKAEFRADWGAIISLQPVPAFGQAYQNCVVVALHKSGVADAYCFYLYDHDADLDELVLNTPATFHSLRFQ